MKALFILLLSCVAITAMAGIHLTASISGTQSVPVVATSATGTGSFMLNDDRTELTYTVSYQGLSGAVTGAHFHRGVAGVNGSVIKGFVTTGALASGMFTGVWKASDATQPLTTAFVESLLTGRVYVNIHTAANPGGEIRGQVNLGTALQFTVDLSSAQENPSNASTGTGTGVFVLSPDRSSI